MKTCLWCANLRIFLSETIHKFSLRILLVIKRERTINWWLRSCHMRQCAHHKTQWLIELTSLITASAIFTSSVFARSSDSFLLACKLSQTHSTHLKSAVSQRIRQLYAPWRWPLPSVLSHFHPFCLYHFMTESSDLEICFPYKSDATCYICMKVRVERNHCASGLSHLHLPLLTCETSAVFRELRGIRGFKLNRRRILGSGNSAIGLAVVGHSILVLFTATDWARITLMKAFVCNVIFLLQKLLFFYLMNVS